MSGRTLSFAPDLVRIIMLGDSPRVRMKQCGYCGRDNDDTATHCRECGEELITVHTRTQVPAPWGKIAVLRSEVEAERLDLELNRLKIPHVMASYRDSAFDGIYQIPKGWGHIEAPEAQASAILSVLEDLRKGTSLES